MPSIPTAAEIVQALGGNPRTGMCRCPCHDDKKPSLCVKTGDNGKPIFKCFAGCEFEAIRDALRLRGIWPNGGKATGHRRRTKSNSADEKQREEEARRWRHGLGLLRAAAKERLIKKKGGPVAYFKERGIKIVPPNAYLVSSRVTSQYTNKSYPAMVIPISSEKGLLGAQITYLSTDLKSKAKTEPIRQSFGLLRGGFVYVGCPDPAKPLLVAEGYEDALSVSQITGLPAIASLGTANMKTVNVPPCSEIIIAADDDMPGQAAAETLAKRLVGRRVRIALPPRGYADWNEALTDVPATRLRKLLLKAPKVETPGFSGTVNMVELMAMAIPPMTHCLKPILLKVGRTMLSARAGHLKTRLALSIAYAKATGTSLMDWTADEPGSVLYIDAELSAENILAWWRRLGPPCANLHLLSDKLNFRCSLPRVTLATEEGRRYLTDEVAKVNPVLIVLDSLFTLAPPEMGSDRVGESLWPAVHHWIDAQVLAGRHVLLLHHDNKGGQQYGSVLKEIQLDCWLQLKKQPKLDVPGRFAAELTFNKPRHLSVEEQMPRIITINTEGVIEWRREDAEAGDEHGQRDTQIREAYAGGKTIAELADEFKLSYERVRQIVREG